jgi:catechol 2,3-dioxygenase-like lactoylglutathione lyase family enzyme
MSLMSIRVGTNDLDAARAFYDATFAALGIGKSSAPPEYPVAMYHMPGGPVFLIGGARDGQPATPANGGTIGFAAPSEAAVAAWHAAGLANGGSCEGPPGPRELAGGKQGAYLRDPDGNKLCVFHGLTIGG